MFYLNIYFKLKYLEYIKCITKKNIFNTYCVNSKKNL